MADELTRGSAPGRDALQRYVIAWAEQERLRDQALAASQRMRDEELVARRYLRDVGESPIPVDLLDGSTWQVFADSAGIVVVPRAAD